MSRMDRLLRPMTWLDILDGAFDLYKTNLATLLGIVAVVYVPVQGMVILARILFVKGNPTISGIIDLLYLGLMMVSSFLVMGPSMWAISEAYLGHKISVMTAYNRMLPRVFPFGLTYLLWVMALLVPYFIGAVIVGIGIGIGIVTHGDSAMIIVGIAAAVLLGIAAMLVGVGLYVSLIFTCPSFVAEDKRYFAALQRSWSLIKGYFWRTLGISLLAFLIIGIVQMVIAIAMSAATGLLKDFILNPQSVSVGTPYLIYQTGTMIASIAIEPIWLITIILLYYDLRIRKEGFDLQALAMEMGYRETERTEPVSTYVEAGPGASTASEDRPPLE